MDAVAKNGEVISYAISEHIEDVYKRQAQSRTKLTKDRHHYKET